MPIVAGERQQQAFQVDLAIVATQQMADHVRAMRGQQGAGRFRAAGRIVVAGDDDQLQRWQARARLLQEYI